MLYPIELRAPIPVITAKAALGVRDDARTAHRFAVSESIRDKKRRQAELVTNGANRAATTDNKTAAATPRPNGRYKTRTCDLHDVNVAL